MKKGHYRKIIFAFLGIIFLTLFALWAVGTYQEWRDRKKLDQLVERMQQWEKDIYKEQMADIFGGKTPYETLKMFIEAIEKKDYKLASSYFVSQRRDEWLERFKNIEKNNTLGLFINYLKEGLIVINNEYSKIDEEWKRFGISDPMRIDFVLYPNGIWKIDEI